MSKKTLFALLLLLPCVCRAGEYSETGSVSVESALDRNYNVLFSVLSPGVSNGNLFFSFNWFHIRFMKDTDTWRFSIPLPLMCLSVAIGISPGATPSPKNAFDSLYQNPPFFKYAGGIIPNIPLMLANPTVGLKLTEWLYVATGYNTDFCFIPRPQIYFAPKMQLGLAIAQNFLLSTILSYQVVDFFATKRGLLTNYTL